MVGEPVNHSIFPPCRVTRADCSGCQWGVRADRANIHPDTQALFTEEDVEKNRPRAPDHQQSSCKCRRTPTPPVTAMHGPTGPASDPEPLHPPAPELRGMAQHGAWSGGGGRRRGCLRTAPRPGLHAGGRVEVRDHGSARGRAGIRGNGRSFPWPGGHESGGTCGMAVDGRGLMGSMHRRCFSSSSSLNTNSSIGRLTNLVRRGIPRRGDVIELVLWPEHAGIVSCTLTLPKYPSPSCRRFLHVHQSCARWPVALRS